MAVYWKRCLNPVRLAVPDTFSNLEAVCIDLNINHNTRILCIYRPPNCNSLYSDNLCELITYFVSGSDNIVIFGDFNLPDIQWSSYSYSIISVIHGLYYGKCTYSACYCSNPRN